MPVKDEQLSVPDCNEAEGIAEARESAVIQPAEVEVGLLTGCQDRPYAFGLAMALALTGVRVDFIGSETEDSPELHQNPRLKFHNLKRNWRRNANAVERGCKLLVYYAR